MKQSVRICKNQYSAQMAASANLALGNLFWSHPKNSQLKPATWTAKLCTGLHMNCIITKRGTHSLSRMQRACDLEVFWEPFMVEYEVDGCPAPMDCGNKSVMVLGRAGPSGEVHIGSLRPCLAICELQHWSSPSFIPLGARRKEPKLRNDCQHASSDTPACKPFDRESFALEYRFSRAEC